jgi:uncharacterized protein DUF5681
MHPNSVANLKPAWRKGQSGNPGGRPRKLPITEALASVIDQEKAEQLANVVWQRADKGESWAIQFIADRLEGKAIAREEHGQPGEFEVGLEQARKILELGKYRDPSKKSSVEP